MGAVPSAERSTQRIWMLLLASSVLYFFSANQADNDLWGHVLFGRDILAAGAIPRVDTYAYTTAGHAWVNHEWLSQVLLAAAYHQAGSQGLLLLKFAVAAATFGLLFGALRRRSASPHIWGGVGLLAIAVLARGFAIRPQIFTYCGVALTLWLLDRYQHGQRRALWWFPPIFLLWVNVHGGFALGLAILGLFATADLFRGSERSLRPWIALLASIMVTTFNPNGPRLLLYVWSELSRAHPITEWQPAASTDAAQFVFFAMLALLVVTLPFTRGWRQHGWHTLLALGIGFLAMRHQRHTPVFAVCAAAPLAAQLNNAAGWLTQRFTLSAAARRLLGGAMVALALLQVAFAGLRVQRDGLQITFDPAEYPTAAVRALRYSGMHANLAVPLDWGEYALWFLAPQIKVSLDGRFATLFPEQVVEDTFNFFSGAAGWRRLLEQYPTDAALVPVDSPCLVRREPGWQRVYGDAVAEVYVRANREAAGWNVAPTGSVPGIFP